MNKIGYYWFNRKYYLRREIEFAAFRLAKRIPKRLRYYIVMDAVAKATTGKYGSTNPNELNVMELLNRLRKGNQ